MQFQSNLVSAISYAIIATDLQFNVQSWNASAAAMYGWTATDVIGKPLNTFIQNEFVDGSREESIKAVTEKSFWKGEVVQTTKGGSKIPVLASVALFKDGDGRPLGFVAVNRDISEHKKAEQALNELLERERQARLESETARKQLSFLVESSTLLSETYNYQDRLEKVAQIAFPTIADWCAIDLLEDDGSINRVAVVHSDPAKVEWAYEIQRRYPPDPSAPRGTYNVLRTGVSELYSEIHDSILGAASLDEEHLRLLRSLGFKSAMVVPFRARERNFGVIIMVIAESGRQYNENALATVEGLSKRAAPLIDNARLYNEAQALNAELELRVRESTAELKAINKEEERDLIESYNLGVNAYVVKPVDFKELIAAVKEISLFWAVLNEPTPGSSKRASK